MNSTEVSWRLLEGQTLGGFEAKESSWATDTRSVGIFLGASRRVPSLTRASYCHGMVCS